ncbi:ATP-dependent DNA helicase PcrA [Candidatus Shapirobacteria bacterium CG08_land_8_20_14_0_20_39_18]|uniref:DNA 3'-5' helicase n=1 Tax=Candidatus Shapirobacteria bacterium CG08_land_8_20_14_0_20_39_18 TaxID=1974883 RepID=A0A2M6XCI9_9BACT|nr:MAG: ATP-dependent DNA helicase PcrA [Candidatus Shapirobacteria bacterium CG08_land_8_20_14_0_20_39_18]PIY66489.1 MAG: ATP-dependent DNA helicase PcrA [Candidatus Shapirobacteria bacterium CG_4_10_14_0_8_um_filter_39_15]PJE68504.1 MAG: ATP-dependent DNA helicase PcrA [Candidatus Shapirobacteria bacterium CG10_big_fil_rev_8_21_14_0_10_38_8]
MDADIISSLNPDQQEAVTYKNGPLLILAGAGSGKTRVLTHRAAWLIKDKNVSPENILLLTFTNKAAGEMKSRIENLLASRLPCKGLPLPASNVPWAGTFHSFCAKILRQSGLHLDISPRFIIFDTADQIDTIKQALIKLDLSAKDYNPAAVLNTISQAKNELISPLDYPQYVRGQFQQTVARIYPLYQKLLKEQNGLDFDDLLFETVKLLQKFPVVLTKYQDQYRYLLVDEWQDTNKAQYVFIKLLAKKYHQLTVVGDASQAIYGWRGADYRNINYLTADFPDLKIINLEQNYRSTQKILNAANEVIKHNQSHPILKLWTKNPPGENIGLFSAGNELDEAQFIINTIQSLAVNPLPLAAYAVLYRTNAQSRIIEEVFLRNIVPYTLVGGVRFYERKEIKDVLAYLRLTINLKDLVSLQRIEKIGKTKTIKFLNWMEDNKDRLEKLTTLEILDEVLQTTKFLDSFHQEIEEDLMRLENIKELRTVANQFPQMVEFLENVTLVERQYSSSSKRLTTNDKQPNAVTLMTAHAAKGLEFPVVFMVGMEEGLFPHAHSLFEPLGIEEERRLAYVGMTRAKQKLFLSFAQKRFYFGRHSANAPSRFISDIPEDLIEMIE